MVHKRIKLGSVKIPNYIRRIKLSNSQRAKYFEWNNTTIKSGSKKLFQKCIDKKWKNAIIINNGNVLPQWLADDYHLIEFKGDKAYKRIYHIEGMHILNTQIAESLTVKQMKRVSKFIVCKKIDGYYERVLSNPAQVNKAKWHIIKGQDMYVGMNPFVRNKLVTELKDSYYDVFKNINQTNLDNIRASLMSSFPLIIEMEIRDTIKNQFDKTKEGDGIRWDVGNRADPYMKTFLDFLVNGYVNEYNQYLIEPIIPDDDRLHISGGNNAIFTPIEENAEPSLIFYFYKDDRMVWKKLIKQIDTDENK